MKLYAMLLGEFIEKVNEYQGYGDDNGQISKHLCSLVIAFYRYVLLLVHYCKFPVQILKSV